MSEVVDIDAKSLGSQEIERLLQSSRAALYTKSVSAPKKPSGSFQKKSLIELARTADAKSGAPVAGDGFNSSDQNTYDQNTYDQNTYDQTPSGLKAEAPSGDTAPANVAERAPKEEAVSASTSAASPATAEQTEPEKPRARRARPQPQPPRPPKVKSDEASASQDANQETKDASTVVEEKATEISDVKADSAETNGAEKGDAELASETALELEGEPALEFDGDPDTEPAEFETRSLEQLAIQAEEKNAAEAAAAATKDADADLPETGKPEQQTAEYTRAYEEGRASMQAEMVEELGDAFTTLNNMINELRTPSGNPYAELSQIIHDRVLALASERAGQQIESLPMPFLDKISGLVNSVEEAGRAIKIKLSVQDLESIKPLIASNSELDVSIFAADDKLQSGDVIISAGAVAVKDVMAARVADPVSEDDASFAAIGRAMRDLIGDTETDPNAVQDEALDAASNAALDPASNSDIDVSSENVSEAETAQDISDGEPE
jgi:flagellar biosynthesis/type III secretory pathway protein FliH